MSSHLSTPLKASGGASAVLLARRYGKEEAPEDNGPSSSSKKSSALLLPYLEPVSRQLLVDHVQANNTYPLVFISSPDQHLTNTLMTELLSSRQKGSHVRVNFLLDQDPGSPRLELLTTGQSEPSEKGQEEVSWLDMIQSRIKAFIYGDDSSLTDERTEGEKEQASRGVAEGLDQALASLASSSRRESSPKAVVDETTEEQSPTEPEEEEASESRPDNTTMVIDLDPLIMMGSEPSTLTSPHKVDVIATTLIDVLLWAKQRADKDHQILLSVGGTMGLWKLRQLLLAKEVMLSSSATTKSEEEEQEGSDESRILNVGVLDLPFVHLHILGPNKILLNTFASEVSSLCSTVPPDTEAADRDTDNEEGATDTAARSSAISAPPEAGEWVELGDASEVADSDFKQNNENTTDTAAPSSAVSIPREIGRLIELGASVGTWTELADLMLKHNSLPGGETHESNPASIAIKSLIAKEKGRLMAKLGVDNDGNVKEKITTPNNGAALLWDALVAIHGERVDILTGTSMGAQGVLPLEALLNVCGDDLDNVERLLTEGWIKLMYEPESDSAEALIQCKATSVTLRTLRTPLLEMSCIGTPPLVHLAWKEVYANPKIVLLMNARVNARRLKRETDVLDQNRVALENEWNYLLDARTALRERKGDLSEEEFITLQLELIRLERAASSRGYEMQLRAKRLRSLREELDDSEILFPEEIPSLPSIQIDKPTIEDLVVSEMSYGIRGVPVEKVTDEEDQNAQKERKRPSMWTRWFRRK